MVNVKLYNIKYDIEEDYVFIHFDFKTQKEIKERLEKLREFTISLECLGDTRMGALLKTIDYGEYIRLLTGLFVKSYDSTLIIQS